MKESLTADSWSRPMPGRGRAALPPYLVTGAGLLVALVLNAGIGPVAIPPGTLLRILWSVLPSAASPPDWPGTFRTILIEIRLPHTALIVLAGMALGGSGAAFQGLFRNPLADPYILGVAAGAGLGAVLAMSGNWSATMVGTAAIPLAAFLGALLTVALVYRIARVEKTTPITTLLLAGIAVGTFASALTSLILLLATNELHRAIAWLLGGFTLGGWRPVLASLPYLGLGLGALVILSRPLNVLQFGDEQALQLGLDVERYKLVIVLSASLVAATAVAFTGIIGYVGLIVPHIVRMLWGPDYQRLIPVSILGGAAILLAADTVARTALAPRDLPVGVVTAVVGVPFFLWLLRRAKNEVFW